MEDIICQEHFSSYKSLLGKKYLNDGMTGNAIQNKTSSFGKMDTPPGKYQTVRTDRKAATPSRLSEGRRNTTMFPIMSEREGSCHDDGHRMTSALQLPAVAVIDDTR